LNIDVLSPSSDSSSDSRTSSSSGESRLDEFHRNILQRGEVLGYQFEPRRNTNSDSAELADNEDDQIMSIDEEESFVRLGNLDW
jgi:hypothetical protein